LQYCALHDPNLLHHHALIMKWNSHLVSKLSWDLRNIFLSAMWLCRNLCGLSCGWHWASIFFSISRLLFSLFLFDFDDVKVSSRHSWIFSRCANVYLKFSLSLSYSMSSRCYLFIFAESFSLENLLKLVKIIIFLGKLDRRFCFDFF
jgi:hypothetical protein